MVNVKVVNDESPWLKGTKDQMFTIPISHGEGVLWRGEAVLTEDSIKTDKSLHNM